MCHSITFSGLPLAWGLYIWSHLQSKTSTFVLWCYSVAHKTIPAKILGKFDYVIISATPPPPQATTSILKPPASLRSRNMRTFPRKEANCSAWRTICSTTKFCNMRLDFGSDNVQNITSFLQHTARSSWCFVSQFLSWCFGLQSLNFCVTSCSQSPRLISMSGDLNRIRSLLTRFNH